jgi:LacI family transcriptional regulator
LAERKRGYAAALKENGLPQMQTWIKEVSIVARKEEVEDAINELLTLPEPVDVILFASNYISVFGLKYIVNLPLKVPDDLALISFDESDAADLFYSPVTHMKQPLKEMGQLATRILIENIEKNATLKEVNLEPEFVIRKSTSAKKNSYTNNHSA